MLAGNDVGIRKSFPHPRLLLDSSHDEDTVVALEHSELLNIDRPLTTLSVGDTVKMPDSIRSEGLKGESIADVSGCK